MVIPVTFGVKLSSIQALPPEGCALLNVFHIVSVPWYPLLPLKACRTVWGVWIALNKGSLVAIVMVIE